jgi:hypothetical protein
MTTTEAPGGWLVMIYLAGDNNLTEEMVLALQELRAEGLPSGDRIVAQFDPSGTGLFSQRYDFTDAPHGTSLEGCRDRDFHESVNTGEPQALVDFAAWAFAKYADPKLKILLVLSGHGSGTTDDFLLKDENAHDALSIPELRDALLAISKHAARKIDVVGLDACYMSMGEVAFEIRESTRLLVGSEGLEPGFGWPYRRILAAVKSARHSAGTPMPVAALGRLLVDVYVDHYSAFDATAGRSVDLACLDLERIDPVVVGIAHLTDALLGLDPTGHRSVLVAHWYAQTFKFDQYVDLRDFCGQLKGVVADPQVARACDEIDAALQHCIVRAGCSGFAYQHSHGLSIYFPWAYLSPDYRKLAFCIETNWHRFLHRHIHETRREPRSGMDRVRGGRGAHVRGPGGDTAVAGEFSNVAPKDALLTPAAATLQDADLAPADVPRELARRFAMAHSFGRPKNRFTENTKYTENTKGADPTRLPTDRAMCVKNLPPVLGVVFEPE